MVKVWIALPLLATLVSPVHGSSIVSFDVHEHRLANGLLVLTLEDHSVPLMTLQTFYSVGSVNERPGITGAAHYLEHMMFNGAEKYGPKEYDRALEQAGGYSNAYTTFDLTGYFADFPPEALDLVIDLEQDRMQHLALAEQSFQTELSTVREERRRGLEDSTPGAARELLYATAFTAHPYGWPVIGWMSDLENLQTDGIREFWRTFYTPSNCTMVIVGDFDTGALMEKVRAAFEPIPGGREIPKVTTREPPQRGVRRAELEREAELPLLMLGWHAPACADEEWAAMQMALQVLSGGNSSRLDTRLVFDEGLALSIHVGLDETAYPGLFALTIEVAPGHSAAEVEGAVLEEIERLAEDGPTADELATARNQEQMSTLRVLAAINQRADALGRAQRHYGDWRRVFDRASLLDGVTAEEVKRVVAESLRTTNMTVVTVVPISGGEGS